MVGNLSDRLADKPVVIHGNKSQSISCISIIIHHQLQKERERQKKAADSSLSISSLDVTHLAWVIILFTTVWLILNKLEWFSPREPELLIQTRGEKKNKKNTALLYLGKIKKNPFVHFQKHPSLQWSCLTHKKLHVNDHNLNIVRMYSSHFFIFSSSFQLPHSHFLLLFQLSRCLTEWTHM